MSDLDVPDPALSEPGLPEARCGLDPVLAAHLPGAVIAFGPSDDVDAAFDAACDDARTDFGFVSGVPNVAEFDPSRVEELDERAVPLDVAVACAQQRLADDPPPPGVVRAVPVCRPRDFTRRRVSLRVEDLALVLPPPGPVVHVTDELHAAVVAGLVAAGVPLAGGELVESVEVRSDKVRFKAKATTTKAPNVSRLVARDAATGVEVVSFEKMSDLRRELMVRARDPHTGPVTFEVTRETRRASGEPLLVVERAPVARRAMLKVTIVSEKDPARTKQVGWVFFAAGR
jgi:hypothetical protein